MEPYLRPWCAAESEFTEKRSRFICHIWPVTSEAEARALIAEMRSKYHDARHNCWCYSLRDGSLRYSDDGEPQGTAGQPMLNVFVRSAVTDVCCVVTRYFGGILLGAGGLTRAYAQAAKDALTAAQIAKMCLWELWSLSCPYPLYERVVKLTERSGGMVRNVSYGQEVSLLLAFPDTAFSTFSHSLTELTAGALSCTREGEEYLPTGPIPVN